MGWDAEYYYSTWASGAKRLREVHKLQCPGSGVHTGWRWSPQQCSLHTDSRGLWVYNHRQIKSYTLINICAVQSSQRQRKDYLQRCINRQINVDSLGNYQKCAGINIQNVMQNMVKEWSRTKKDQNARHDNATAAVWASAQREEAGQTNMWWWFYLLIIVLQFFLCVYVLLVTPEPEREWVWHTLWSLQDMYTLECTHAYTCRVASTWSWPWERYRSVKIFSVEYFCFCGLKGMSWTDVCPEKCEKSLPLHHYAPELTVVP